MIKENLNEIKLNIKKACQKSNRDPKEVNIIAVTKTVPTNILQQSIPVFLDYNVTIFGENRVQEMLEKYPNIQGISWHMIGNLQRNKVKYIVDKVDMIHSLDSIKLATEINRIAKGKDTNILIEVNIAGEKSKHGIQPELAIQLAKDCKDLVKIKGLMTIAPFVDNPEDNRIYFKKMYEIYKDLQEIIPDVDHLSMGMTGDYEIAVEEGATHIRIGTGIFQKRPQSL